MSTLVEMIEALQADWQKLIRNHFLAIKGKYCPHARKAISECVSELTPILAAARAREKELAELREQVMRYQADPQYDARFIEGQDKTEAAIKERQKAEKWEKALVGLTVGGSEFVGDIDNCVRFIKGQVDSGSEAKKEVVRVTRMAEKMAEALRKCVIAVADLNTPRSLAEKLLREAIAAWEGALHG